MSDNPHIKKWSYFRETGPYSNSVIVGGNGMKFDNGRCENTYNATAKKLSGQCKVLVTDKIYFEHIGEETTLTEKTYNR